MKKIILNVIRLLNSFFLPLFLIHKYNFYIGMPSIIELNSFSFKIDDNVIIGPFAELIIGDSSDSAKKSFVNRFLKIKNYFGKYKKVRNKEMNLIIESNVLIGSHANIRANIGLVKIKKNTRVAQNVHIISSNHSYSDIIKQNWNSHDIKKVGVTIGENVWIGSNVVLLPGVTLGDYSVIGAGSIVTRNVPSREVWAGNPAKFIKKID